MKVAEVDRRGVFVADLGCRSTLQPKKREQISRYFYTLVFAIFLIAAITLFTSSSLILA